MLFSSLVFLFIFLPITLLLYYSAPRNFKNSILLALSLLFYAWGGLYYGLVFIVSLALNYLFALKISTENTVNKKAWLTIGITANIGFIVAFKYAGFIVENINSLLHIFSKDSTLELKSLSIALPLGISFYTFHQMSMLWDIYKNPVKQKIAFVESALYVSFFPQLIAGPIVRYHDIIYQIRQRKETLELFTSGVERFIIGLAKKVILANTAAAVADTVFSYQSSDITTPAAWIGIIAYTLQIFFDFSGYSDMAIGLGKMFGFRILENFNLPYLSKSIQEFWRRWHISLSSWFRDYVYIPLGGNRISEKRTYVNLLIVFLLTGFWHGATWTFVFWGLFHGFFIIIERLGFGKVLAKIPKLFSWSYAMLVVIIGWVFFRLDDFQSAIHFISKLFGIENQGQLTANYFLNNEKIIILAISAFIAINFTFSKESKLATSVVKVISSLTLLRQTVLLGILFYAIVLLNSSSYNPFIYFKF